MSHPIKAYKLNRDATPTPDTIDALRDLHKRVAIIDKEEKELAVIEANITAMRREHIAPLEKRAAKKREEIAGQKAVILADLLKQPKENQKLLRGDKTYYVHRGAESVEILDEAKALAEVKAIGPAGMACIQVKRSLSKSALKVFLKNPEAPILSHIRIKDGQPTLAEKAT